MAEKNDNRMLYGVIAVLVLILAYVVYNNYVVPGQKTARQQAAVDSVKKIYETLTESSVDILTVKEESGMYRVTFSFRDAAGARQVQEVLVTQDGAFFTDRAIDSKAFLDRVTKEKAFAECLASKKLLVLGQSTDINTQTQLQLLGSFWRKFYVDCTGTNLQLCQQAGITQVPTTVYEGKTYVGIQTTQFYEQLTGCKLS